MIDKFKLLLNRVKITPTVAAQIESKLSRSPALYPIRSMSCKTFNIPENAKHYECSPFGQVGVRVRVGGVRVRVRVGGQMRFIFKASMSKTRFYTIVRGPPSFPPSAT